MDRDERIFQSIRRDEDLVVQDLLEHLPDVNIRNQENQSLLHEAIACQRYTIVQQLIDRGINLDHQDYRGQTALHFAAEHRTNEVLNLLIRKGANVSLADKFGNEPLWTAVFNADGQYESVRALLAAGADPRHINSAGKSPLDLARRMGDSELLGILEGWA